MRPERLLMKSRDLRSIGRLRTVAQHRQQAEQVYGVQRQRLKVEDVGRSMKGDDAGIDSKGAFHYA